RAWTAPRKGLVGGRVAALAVAWFGAAVLRMMSDKREAKARELMGTAMGPLSRPLAADLPPGAPADPPPFKTAQERDQAARAALEGVRTTHPGTRAAQSATLALAGTEMRLGQVDAAIGHFEEDLRQGPPGGPLPVAALRGAGR